MSVQRVNGKFAPAPVVDGRKQCVHCREWKPVDTEFNAKTRDAAGQPRTWQSYCRPCATLMNRERKGYRTRPPALTPEQKRERRREQNRRRMEAIRADPELLDAWREGVRFKEKLRRERQGAKPYPPRRMHNGHVIAGAWRVSSPSQRGEEDVVDAAPFVRFVLSEFAGMTPSEVALKFATSERRIHSLVSGVEPRASLAWVDRALTIGLGRPDLLNDLYPLDMDQAA